MTIAAPEVPRATFQLSKQRVRIIVAALLLAVSIGSLDQTIVATALPTIIGDLHGGSHLAWVVTAYLLAQTVSMPLWGKLGDLYGRKRFLQAGIVLFLIGSILSGLAASMSELIAFRAVQGLGAGGLLVGVLSVLGDVVSARDRGRYQGLFGGVFGVASIAGPLLGGVFVEDLSWRWIFYINMPIGAAAFAGIAICVPGHLSRIHHVIDYLGIILLTTAVASFVLMTSLGGTSYRWGSTPIVTLGVAGVVLLSLWAYAEKRAVEPVLPLKLFANKVFWVTCGLSFVTGLVLFGSLVFLPLYFQDIRGLSPTISGLHLLPFIGSFLVTNVLVGQIVTRTGRYRVFPIMGMAFVAIALSLFAFLRAMTSFALLSVYMICLGIGIGCIMQLLTIVIQNAVSHRELGTATSSVTFFRTIGGSFGTAIFGAIFSNVLVSRIAVNLADIHLNPERVRAIEKQITAQGTTPTGYHRLPTAIHAAVSIGFTQALDVVFLVGVPIALAALVLAIILPERSLNEQAHGIVMHDDLSIPQVAASAELS